MSIIVTNEITVPADRAQAVAAKFAANAEGLKNFDGYEGFELCRPTSPDDNRWLVISKWRDTASYQAWRDSVAFNRSHGESGKPTAKGVPANSVVRHYQVELTRP